MTEYRSQKPRYRAKYDQLYRAGYRMSVDALGPRRRLQALLRIGYTYVELMPHIGIEQPQMWKITTGIAKTVHVTTARKIAELYDELHWKPRDPSMAPHIKRGINWAIKKGYAPPGAWDDIDNPLERPKGIAICVIDGCQSQAWSRDLCSWHYKVNRKEAA